MSDLEALVKDWLDRHNIEYQFQSVQLGGIYALGGSVVDFLIYEGNIALRVMGEFFHKSIEKQGMDEVQRELLTQQGFVVVDVWGTDLEENLNQTMQLAVQGVEMT